jgi:hypothetical protein
MALIDHDQASIRQYLLGKLSLEEQETIEERLMVEDDLFQELEILKGELIEEYRDGELNEVERKSFEQGFLASAEGRRGQAFAIAIECLERNQPKPAGMFARFAALFRKPQWAWTAVASAAVVIVVMVLSVQSLRQPPKFVAVTLTSSAGTRGAGDSQYPRVILPSDASELRITLTLPQPATPGSRYRVKFDNRREITTLQPSGQDANSVSVVIPTRQVPAGLYALVVYEIKPDGTEQQIPGNYFFITQ